MNIQVVFTTQLKAALDKSSETLSFDRPPTVAAVITQLTEQHGEAFRRLVLDAAGCPLPSILFCVGDAQVTFDDPAPLSDSAELTILSAISGG